MATQFENESTALVLTIEKCREITNCPDGVDLQDWVKQLAAENVALKQAESNLVRNIINDLGDTEFQYARVHTPATDRIVAGIKADGATAAGDYLKLNAQHMSEDERLRMQDAAEICYGTAARLREGDK